MLKDLAVEMIHGMEVGHPVMSEDDKFLDGVGSQSLWLVLMWILGLITSSERS